MTKTIVAIGILLALLTAAEHALVKKYNIDNPRYISAAPLADPAKVTEISVKAVGLLFSGENVELEMIYERDGDAWRVPMYRNAYAVTDRVNGIVRDLVAARGLVVDRRGLDDSAFGFTQGNLRIRLYGANREVLLETICGRAIPGYQQNESYVRITGSDAIYHINGNPILKLGSPQEFKHPLVDPKVIPDALGSRGELTRISYEPADAYDIKWIERRKKTGGESPLPPGNPMRDMKQYDWFADTDGRRETKLNERTTVSYTNFINRLTYNTIPKASELTDAATMPSNIKIVMLYEKPKNEPAPGEKRPEPPPETFTEYLELRGFDKNGDRFLFYSGTGLVYAIPQQKADLLFPTLDGLANPAPQTGVYEPAPPAQSSAAIFTPMP
jgi:hypothetical protein